MSENIENPSNPLDIVKWVLAVALLIGAVAVNQYFPELSVLYRAIGIVALVAIALFVAAATTKGTQFLAFAKEARTETRKVVWPTRQEATQTTMIVLAATFVMALLLWGLDGILVRVVSFVTGLGI
jgi:preprotein translocase subunit SecE